MGAAGGALIGDQLQSQENKEAYQRSELEAHERELSRQRRELEELERRSE
jgi:hypothetical protein